MRGDQVETALAACLAGLGFTAKPYPQNPAGYTPDDYPGEALIRYTGRKLSDTDIADLRVEDTLSFEIVFVSQELYGENGLYRWLEQVFTLLHGHSVDGLDGVPHMESEELLDEYNGTWQYSQKWTIKTTSDHGRQDDYADRAIGS